MFVCLCVVCCLCVFAQSLFFVIRCINVFTLEIVFCCRSVVATVVVVVVVIMVVVIVVLVVLIIVVIVAVPVLRRFALLLCCRSASFRSPSVRWSSSACGVVVLFFDVLCFALLL